MTIMDYDQIKKDVEEFKKLADKHGIYGYCILGSLLLEACLSDHKIKAELIKGYIISNNKHWILHVWTKIHINTKTHQIDMVPNPAKEMGIRIQYTLILNDKWGSIIDTDEEQADHDAVIKAYNYYQENGYKKTLLYLSKHAFTDKDEVIARWNALFKDIRPLKTFSTINKYKKLLF